MTTAYYLIPSLKPEQWQPAGDLWRQGKGTLEIAEALGVEEECVYHSLHHVKRWASFKPEAEAAKECGCKRKGWVCTYPLCL